MLVFSIKGKGEDGGEDDGWNDGEGDGDNDGNGEDSTYQPVSTCTNQAMVGPGKDQDLNQEFDNIVLSSLKSLLPNR